MSTPLSPDNEQTFFSARTKIDHKNGLIKIASGHFSVFIFFPFTETKLQPEICTCKTISLNWGKKSTENWIEKNTQKNVKNLRFVLSFRWVFLRFEHHSFDLEMIGAKQMRKWANESLFQRSKKLNRRNKINKKRQQKEEKWARKTRHSLFARLRLQRIFFNSIYAEYNERRCIYSKRLYHSAFEVLCLVRFAFWQLHFMCFFSVPTICDCATTNRIACNLILRITKK